MPKTGFEWYQPPERVFVPAAAAYVANIEAGILAIANQYAPEIESWMKSNHPWQNRTGAAEAGLHTEVEHVVGSMIRVILSHGADVEYSIWLEVAHAGRFAVITPALDMWGSRIWEAVQGLMR